MEDDSVVQSDLSMASSYEVRSICVDSSPHQIINEKVSSRVQQSLLLQNSSTCPADHSSAVFDSNDDDFTTDKCETMETLAPFSDINHTCQDGVLARTGYHHDRVVSGDALMLTENDTNTSTLTSLSLTVQPSICSDIDMLAMTASAHMDTGTYAVNGYSDSHHIELSKDNMVPESSTIFQSVSLPTLDGDVIISTNEPGLSVETISHCEPSNVADAVIENHSLSKEYASYLSDMRSLNSTPSDFAFPTQHTTVLQDSLSHNIDSEQSQDSSSTSYTPQSFAPRSFTVPRMNLNLSHLLQAAAASPFSSDQLESPVSADTLDIADLRSQQGTPDPEQMHPKIIPRRKKVWLLDDDDDRNKTPLNEELRNGLRILKEIMSDINKSLNWPFMEAVDTVDVPEYYDRIETPMWLRRSK